MRKETKNFLYSSKKWVLFIDSPTTLFKREFVKKSYLYLHTVAKMKLSQLFIIGEADRNLVFVKRNEDEKNFKEAKIHYQKNLINKYFFDFKKIIKEFRKSKDSFATAVSFWEKVAPILLYTYYTERIFTERMQRISQLTKREAKRVKELTEQNGEIREKIAHFGYPAINKAYHYLKRKKLNLKKLDYISLDEIKSGRINNREVAKREKFYVELTTCNKTDIYTGKIANNLLKKEGFKKVIIDQNISQIKGIGASAGKINGAAILIHKVSDFKNQYSGKIIIAPRTVIEYVPFLKKVKAIVTDIGGVNCHAAIISRELKIPCVVGTKIATQIFKDGDLIEVDADKGIVRKLN